MKYLENSSYADCSWNRRLSGIYCPVGLHVYYATPWSVLYATRVIQTIALTIANTILVSVLYQSALTTYVNQVFALQRTREV